MRCFAAVKTSQTVCEKLLGEAATAKSESLILKRPV